MTVYALRLENGTDTAARVRMADTLALSAGASNVTARSGVRPGVTAADVAVVSSTMQVTVQPFLAWIDGAAGDTQAGYPFVSDAVETLTLADGHASLSRTDVIVARVRDDSYDGSGFVDAAVEVVQGTAGSGAPSLPANCVPLRNVVVPAGASLGGGGLTSGALSTDRRIWLTGLGGVVPVATQAERDALPAIAGTVVYRADTDTVEHRRGGGTWERLDGGSGHMASPARGAAVGITTEYELLSTAVTLTAGRCVKLTLTDTITASVAGSGLAYKFYRDATLLATLTHVGVGTTSESATLVCVDDSPPAGSVVYKVTAAAVNTSPQSLSSASLIVEDIGRA